MSKSQKHETTAFTIVREFNAPKKLVFNAFSNAEALNEWWGPVESKNSTIKLEFKTGGIFHFKMESHGKASYGRFLFSKIQPHDLLEFTNAFADENANIIKAPFDIQLPIEIFYRLVFSENNGKTTITLTGKPVNPNIEELEGFISINDGMHQGFGATFDMLVIYLEKKQSEIRH